MKRIFIFFLIVITASVSGNAEFVDGGIRVYTPDGATQVVFLSGEGLGTFENLKDNSLDVSTGVYTTSGKILTTTAPVTGTLGFWTRTTGTLTTATAGDDIETTGTLTATTIGAYQAVGAIDFNSQNLTNVKIVSDFAWEGTVPELFANASTHIVILGSETWNFSQSTSVPIFGISSAGVTSVPIFQATAGLKMPQGEFIGTTTDLNLMQLIDDLVTFNGSLRSGHIGIGTAPRTNAGFVYSEIVTDTITALEGFPILNADVASADIVSGANFSAEIRTLVGTGGTPAGNDQAKLAGTVSGLRISSWYNGTIDKMVYFDGVNLGIGVFSNVTELCGLRIPAAAKAVSGTLLTAYGVKLGDQSAATTQGWAIFSEGGVSSFKDGIRIGDNTAPGDKFEVVGVSQLGDGGTTNYTQFASSGLLTMAGTARVLRSVDFEPDAVKKGGVGPTDSTEDGFPMHDYQAANDESVHIHWEIPHWYASGGEVHLHVEFFVDTAPGGAANVTWGIEYKKQSIGDNFGFTGTTTIITNTALTTGTPANDQKIHSSAEIHLVTTGFEPMDVILIRIFRDANASETDATDNFGSDARVFNYHLMALSDKQGQGT